MPVSGASAKINLFLHAGDKRDDGFHPLQSLVVFTALGDALTAEENALLALEVTGPFAAGLTPGDNLVLKAAGALAARARATTGSTPGAKLTLAKNLPVASGIGGGSADAAAALRLLDQLWQVEAGEAALLEIAADLGSDIPACLASHPCFMEGRGEKLFPIAALCRLPLLLVNPGVPLATKDVFAGLDARRGVATTLPQGRFHDLAELLRFLEGTGNDLEAPALALQPAIGVVLDALKALPGALFTRMSGSGPTCFAIFPDDESCARAATLLRKAHPGWWVAPTFVPSFNVVREDTGRDIGPSPDGI